MNDFTQNWHKALGMLIVVFGVTVVGVYTTLHTQQNLVGGFNPTAAGTYLLKSSITKTQDTIPLTSFTEPSSGIAYTMSYLNSSIEYGTLSPSNGTTDNSELISFTGITQNANGTATLTGVTRGLSRTPGTGGCVASSTLAHAYAGQTKFILSNSPCFYAEYAVKQNNENISGTWNFQSLPTTTVTCTDGSQFCNKDYIDSGLSAGAATSTFARIGIVTLATDKQMASSTASSTSGSPLVVLSKFATTTPGNQCTLGIWNCLPIANSAGKLAQAWLNLTENFTVSGIWNFTSNVGVATSSPYAPLSVVGAKGVVADIFTATSSLTTATSSLAGNLTVARNASTTNLWISGTCVGCANGLAQITNTGSGPTSAAAQSTVSTNCTNGRIVVGGGASINTFDSGELAIVASYPADSDTWSATASCYIAGGGCAASTITVTAICVNP